MLLNQLSIGNFKLEVNTKVRMLRRIFQLKIKKKEETKEEHEKQLQLMKVVATTSWPVQHVSFLDEKFSMVHQSQRNKI